MCVYDYDNNGQVIINYPLHVILMHKHVLCKCKKRKKLASLIAFTMLCKYV